MSSIEEITDKESLDAVRIEYGWCLLPCDLFVPLLRRREKEVGPEIKKREAAFESKTCRMFGGRYMYALAVYITDIGEKKGAVLLDDLFCELETYLPENLEKISIFRETRAEKRYEERLKIAHGRGISNIKLPKEYVNKIIELLAD